MEGQTVEELSKGKAYLDHKGEFYDLLASVFDIFGFPGREHLLQLFADLASSLALLSFKQVRQS